MVIHILVGGHFHADHMANAFVSANHEVHLFTSFPKSRFRLSAGVAVHAFPVCEVFRLIGKKLGNENIGDKFKIAAFGFCVRTYLLLRRMKADVFIGWSSFSIEVLRLKHAKKRFVIRDSSHIEYQMNLLKTEYSKMGIPFPDRNWVVRRELSEYAAADEIIVLSDYARKTFESRGFNNLRVLRLGVETKVFARKPSEVEDHRPVRVVNFGSLSVRKGIHYLLEAVSFTPAHELELHLIGAIEPGFEGVLKKFPQVKVLPPMSQSAVAAYLQHMDIFVMPSLEDGFGQTVIQAMAMGLAVITTDQCGAAELVKDGQNGLVVKAGDARELRFALDRLSDVSDRNRLGAAAAATVIESGWGGYEETLKRWALEWGQMLSNEGGTASSLPISAKSGA